VLPIFYPINLVVSIVIIEIIMLYNAVMWDWHPAVYH